MLLISWIACSIACATLFSLVKTMDHLRDAERDMGDEAFAPAPIRHLSVTRFVTESAGR